MVNVIVVLSVLLIALVWVAMKATNKPEDKLDESVKVEEHSDNEE
jgi:hypothetical protein